MSEATTPAPLLPEVALGYFCRPRGHFWRWVEEGKVIEWRNGNTIAYREELARGLRGLLTQGLPPLPAVLLLLAACADTWPAASGGVAVLENLLAKTPTAPDDPAQEVLARQLRHALLFMDVVRALPPALRSDQPKVYLLQTVFQVQAPQVPAELARAVVDEWNSGRLDERLLYSCDYLTRRQLLQELDCLALALNRFPSPDQLALHLRTGLDHLPTPPPLPDLAAAAPEPAAPARPTERPTDLLDQLAEDARTAGLAQLAQRLGAALRAPRRPPAAAGDQPLGGVADVSNRGSFDRLLLSELAYDDLTFVARLANNEALYLRREVPPAELQVRPRTILLDTTLRLWGVPRVFALAAALAWARQTGPARPAAPLSALALGGEQATPLDLTSFEGVVTALSQLDPAPHAGPALQAFGRAQSAAPAAEVLLITEAGLLHQPAFTAALAEARPALRFLLTVDRRGELALYEYQNGHRQLLSSARYDLDELLFAAPQRRRAPRPGAPPEAPAFLQQEPAPLYFPATGLRVSSRNTFYSAATGVLAITDKRRVLAWPDRHSAARELLPVIEEGYYHFGSDGATTVYVLVSGPRLLRFYALQPLREEVELVDLTEELNNYEGERAVVFRGQCYYVRQGGGTLIFDCQLRKVWDRDTTAFPAAPSSGFRPDVGPIKRHINNGYNVLLRVSRLGVSEAGALVIEGHELRLVSNASTLTQQLYLMSKTPGAAVQRLARLDPAPLTFTANEQLTFRRFEWADGSTAVLDARGLLHLRSAAADVPDITLLLVLGCATAAWAADGTVCGPDYFTGPHPARRRPAAAFSQQYLEPFIAHLT